MELFSDIKKIEKIHYIFLVAIMYIAYQYAVHSPTVPYIVYDVPDNLDSIYVALPDGWSIPASDTIYYPNYTLK